jgi:hypothetical protein
MSAWVVPLLLVAGVFAGAVVAGVIDARWPK